MSLAAFLLDSLTIRLPNLLTAQMVALIDTQRDRLTVSRCKCLIF